MNFIEQYKAARRVSTPLVAIRTFDAKSTTDAIRTSLGDNLKDSALILWDIMHGMRPLTEKGTDELGNMLGGEPVEGTIPLASTLLYAERAQQNVTLFISNAHLQWTNEPAVVQGIWNLRDSFKANGNMLILLCNPGATLPTELVSDVLVLDEPLPTKDEIQQTVRDTFKYAKLDAPDVETLQLATDALIGLPAFPAEQSTAMCLDTKAKKLDIAELWAHKRQLISQTPGLSVWEGTERLEDIGGIESIKAFCHKLFTGIDAPKVIIYSDEIEKAFAGTGTDMSGVKTELTGSMLSWSQDTDMDGLLSIGIPGVGKSQVAKSLGASYGVPVINFDLAGMQSSLVGTSGANLRAAQKTVDAISDGRVLWIATCNSIHALPPELRRRFNLGVFFFDAPDATERAAIWKIYTSKYALQDQTIPDSTGWTGAEIKECCKKAYRLRMTLSEAAEYIVPVTKSSGDLIQDLRQSASGKYLSATKPGVYQAHSISQQTTVPSTVPATRGRIVRNEGE